MKTFSHITGPFQIFSIFVKTSQYQTTAICDNVIISGKRFTIYWIMLHSVCFISEKKKKCSTRFNPYLSVLTKFSYFRDISRISHIYDELIKTDALQGISLHFSNTVVLTIPCATFYYDSCSITKVKTERDAHFPLSTYSKRMFKKRTSNRIDEKPLASRH